MQQLEIVRDYLAKIGIQADLDLKEYAAFIASGYAGIYDGMVYVCESPFYEPDEYLYGQFYSKEARNHSRVNDPKLDKMLEDQRKIKDPAERKKLIDETQRYLISQAYNVQSPQGTSSAAWQPWLKGYKPKGGYDRGTLYEAGSLRRSWAPKEVRSHGILWPGLDVHKLYTVFCALND